MFEMNQSPAVFKPENIPDKVDSIVVSKTWVCETNHSEYSYFVLEVNNTNRFAGFGSMDIPANLSGGDAKPAGSMNDLMI